MASESPVLFELTRRYVLLAIHGVFGVEVGLAMLFTGAPAELERIWGPTTRLTLGLWSLIPGILILTGITLGPRFRGWCCMLVGTIGLGIWEVIMAATYTWVAVRERFVLVEPGAQIHGDGGGRAYIPFVYLTLLLLLMVHTFALLKEGPHQR